jgi:hypothetical protein
MADGGCVDFSKLRAQYESILAPQALDLNFGADLVLPSTEPYNEMHSLVETGIVQTLCQDPYAMFQPLASSTNSANGAMRELVRTIVSGIITGVPSSSVSNAIAELERAVRNDTMSGRFCYEIVRLIAPSFSPLSFQTVASRMREDMRFSPEILTFVEILMGGNHVDPTARTKYDAMSDSDLSAEARDIISAVVRRAATATNFDFASSFFAPS